MKRFFIFSSVLLLTAVIFTSCQQSNQNKYTEDGAIQLQITPAADIKSDIKAETCPQYKDLNNTICILFGYGFNSDQFCSDTLDKLSALYGLDEDGGIIYPVVYPQDVRSRIMNLHDMINEKMENGKNFKGIILLGAPENTHYMLAKIQDEWDSSPSFPIISLFPQDDVLGEESNCTFVLEHARSTADEDSSEVDQKIDDDTVNLLLNTVKYMLELPSTIVPDNDLHAHVQSITGSHKVHRYTDSETGLQSINHFVME